MSPRFVAAQAEHQRPRVTWLCAHQHTRRLSHLLRPCDLGFAFRRRALNHAAPVRERSSCRSRAVDPIASPEGTRELRYGRWQHSIGPAQQRQARGRFFSGKYSARGESARQAGMQRRRRRQAVDSLMLPEHILHPLRRRSHRSRAAAATLVKMGYRDSQRTHSRTGERVTLSARKRLEKTFLVRAALCCLVYMFRKHDPQPALNCFWKRRVILCLSYFPASSATPVSSLFWSRSERAEGTEAFS